MQFWILHSLSILLPVYFPVQLKVLIITFKVHSVMRPGYFQYNFTLSISAFQIVWPCVKLLLLNVVISWDPGSMLSKRLWRLWRAGSSHKCRDRMKLGPDKMVCGCMEEYCPGTAWVFILFVGGTYGFYCLWAIQARGYNTGRYTSLSK